MRGQAFGQPEATALRDAWNQFQMFQTNHVQAVGLLSMSPQSYSMPIFGQTLDVY